MTRLENYWCSRKEWVDFSEEEVKVRDDAPDEAKESYRLYLKQVNEKSKDPDVHIV